MMAWGPYSAEAINLDTEIRRLHAQGRITDAIAAIKEALGRAHREGPSNISYEQFEREVGRSDDAPFEHVGKDHPLLG